MFNARIIGAYHVKHTLCVFNSVKKIMILSCCYNTKCNQEQSNSSCTASSFTMSKIFHHHCCLPLL